MLNNALEQLKELNKTMGTLSRTLEVSKSALYEKLDNEILNATDEEKKKIQRLKGATAKAFSEVENGKGIDVMKKILKEFNNGN